MRRIAVAADLMGWKQKWRPRGQNVSGNIARGLGLSLHTWGGRGHASQCDLTIHPDGSVDIKMGTQDLGTGTRTTIAIVAADTLAYRLRPSTSTSATLCIRPRAVREDRRRLAVSVPPRAVLLWMLAKSCLPRSLPP